MNIKNIKQDIIIGTAQLGTNYGIANRTLSINIEERLNFLDKIYSKGFNTFDTAYAYKNSHKILEYWIKKRNINPKIYTKLNNLHKFSSINTKNLLNKTLKDINKLKIEGLLLHNPLNWENTEIKIFIKEIIKNNIVKNFGLSIYDLKDITRDPEINIIQVPGNIFNQSIINSEIIQNFHYESKEVHVRSIFIQGLLLMEMKDIPPKFSEIKKPLSDYKNLALELNISVSELAILCVKKILPQAKLVLGFDNITQLSSLENIDNLNISDSDIEAVIKLGNKNKNKLWDPRYWN